MKTHFTRKNFISLGLVFFYIMFAFIAALLIDQTNPTGIKNSMNLILKIGHAFGFPGFYGSVGSWTLIILMLVYILIFTAAFIYEMRLAKYYEQKPYSLKWIGIYSATFLISFGLAFGIGMIAQYPYNGEYIVNSILFMIEALFMGFLIFITISLIVGGLCLLIVNFKNIDKPFKYFGQAYKHQQELEMKQEEEELKAIDEMDNLPSSFGDTVDKQGNITGSQGLSGVGGASGIANGVIDEPIKEKERIFPGLCTIDSVEQANRDELFENNINLNELCDQFRNYLASNEKLYFSIDTIRAFISGLSASRLIILEGLSGTGKSSLARYFSDFIGEQSFFEPVQATWRDKTSIIGYYNDFSKSYYETEFLKRLYQANYKKEHINIMVLDEINISRVEYYFADFLSILEYPEDKWQLKIMQLPYDFEGPEMLEDGFLKIPNNTWFIGTANKDDSTYTITDKVYDRAITINFDDRNASFDVEHEVGPINISKSYLSKLFIDAQQDENNQLNKVEIENFKRLTDFTYETFDLTFGNRINNQIELLVPTYVACGGTKNDALDFMFARKIVAKLAGRFEDYIKQGLIELKELIIHTYGANEFLQTQHEIDKLLKKL